MVSLLGWQLCQYYLIITMLANYVDKYKDLKTRINDLETLYNRQIRLIVVSKTQNSEKIITLNNLGQTDFGENYVDEACEKINSIGNSNITWHFIGKIQSNKIKTICNLFDWVHTISSEKHVKKINEISKSINKVMNVCIQINIDNEQTKGGITLEEYDKFSSSLYGLQNIRLRGLMTIPRSDIPSEESFARMYDLYKKNDYLDTLSMGMSSDFVTAIENGANMLRIGQEIFGKRT